MCADNLRVILTKLGEVSTASSEITVQHFCEWSAWKRWKCSYLLLVTRWWWTLQASAFQLSISPKKSSNLFLNEMTDGASTKCRKVAELSLYIKRGKVSVRPYNGGRGQLSSEWRHNGNRWLMEIWRLTTCGHGCTALVNFKNVSDLKSQFPLQHILFTDRRRAVPLWHLSWQKCQPDWTLDQLVHRIHLGLQNWVPWETTDVETCYAKCMIAAAVSDNQRLYMIHFKTSAQLLKAIPISDWPHQHCWFQTERTFIVLHQLSDSMQVAY